MDEVETAFVTITRKDPYDYHVHVQYGTVDGDGGSTTMGATSIKDAMERAATWLGE